MENGNQASTILTRRDLLAAHALQGLCGNSYLMELNEKAILSGSQVLALPPLALQLGDKLIELLDQGDPQDPVSFPKIPSNEVKSNGLTDSDRQLDLDLEKENSHSPTTPPPSETW